MPDLVAREPEKCIECPEGNVSETIPPPPSDTPPTPATMPPGPPSEDEGSGNRMVNRRRKRVILTTGGVPAARASSAGEGQEQGDGEQVASSRQARGRGAIEPPSRGNCTPDPEGIHSRTCPVGASVAELFFEVFGEEHH